MNRLVHGWPCAFALFAPSAAFAVCDDVQEWAYGSVVSLSAPYVTTSGGASAEVQIVRLATDEWWAPVDLVLCQNAFLPGNRPCAAAGMSPVDMDWINVIWPSLDAAGDGGTPDAGADITWYAAGLFDAGTSRMMTVKVRNTRPACGQELRRGPNHDPDLILDNLGVGLVTADTALEDIGPRRRWSTFEPAVQRGVLFRARGHAPVDDPNTTGVDEGDVDPWRSLSPGFTLPISGYDATNALSTTANPPSADAELLPIGESIPSRVAYGRVTWDWLWHGTCVSEATATPSWCLPDGHPRLAADATILAESACVADTCHMDCPNPATATVNDTQVKYDFKVFSTFITDAYGTGPAFPVAGTTPAIVHPSQRSAIRVMPWSDYNSNLPSSLSPPSWLFESCCAGGVCGDALHTGTWSTHAWSLLDPAHAVWRAQIAHLVSALAGEDADLTVGAAPTPAGDGTTFLGFDDDPRVFSVDIGAVGTYGEWSLFGAGDWRIGAGLTYAEGWDPVCLTAGDVTLDEASWWADLIDPWNTSFAHEGGWPRPHIVGKLVYPDVLDEADADTCYLPNEYVVGRRGTHAEGDPAGGYTGQRNGVRYDNWGQIDIVDDYHGGTQAAPAMASQAWRRSSFQAEQWQNFHDMMSMDADPLRPTEVERYGIWDLEETVRFSIARRLSLFRWPVGNDN